MSDAAAPSEPVRLNYQDVGPRAGGAAVVFLHGWGMSLEAWDRQVLALADTHRVVTVDLRGHGYSPKPATGYSYDDHAGDVLALLEHLGLTDVCLVGWSMGGGIAARLAATSERITRLVLVGAPPRFEQSDDFPTGLPSADCHAFYDAVRTDRENTMWDTVVGTCHRDLGAHVNAWLFQLSLRGPSICVLRCYEGVLAADVRPDLVGLRIPVLVLHGVHDRFISVESGRWTAANVPGAQIVEFAQSGHAPFLEETEAFNQALVGFLPSNRPR